MKTLPLLLAAVWFGVVPLFAQNQPAPTNTTPPLNVPPADPVAAAQAAAKAAKTVAVPPPSTNAEVVPAQPGLIPPPGTNSTAVRLPAIPGAFPRRTPTNAVPNFPTLATPGRPSPAAAANAARAAAAAQQAAAAAQPVGEAKGLEEDSTDLIEIKQMPLAQFLEIYANEAKRSLLRGPSLPLQAQIDFKAMTLLTHEERMQMYDTILALNGVTTIPTGDKAVLAVPTAQAMQAGAAFSTLTNINDYAEASQFVTHIVQVKHVAVEEAVETIRQFAQNQNGLVGLPSTKTIVIRDYAINVKRMLEMLEKIDVEAAQEYQLEVIPIRYGKVEDIYATMSSVLGGGGGAGVGGVPSGGGLTGRSTGGSSRGGFGGGRGNVGGFGGANRGGYGTGGVGYSGVGGGYGGGYGAYSAGEFTPQANGTSVITPGAAGTTPGATRPGAASFQGRYGAVNRGPGAANSQVEPLVTDAQITPDTRSNSLIVFASKKDMATIKKVLEKVDTLLPQVLIEGIVMNVSLGNSFNYGISAGQRPKRFNDTVKGGGSLNNGTGTGNPLVGGASFLNGALSNGIPSYATGAGAGYSALLGNNWDVTVNAAETDNRVDVIQRPRLITSHAVEATFFVGSSIPYQQGGYNYGGVASFQYTTIPVGITLSVTPFITPDNLVVMTVSQEISGVADAGSGGAPPTTDQKNAESTVTVRSGDVVLMGGYLDNNKTTANSGVPYLKDIPLLGNLFKSRNDSGSKKELLILVRPTILPKPSDLANYTREQREGSGNIQKLEQSFQADDDKSRAEAEKMNKKKASRAASPGKVPMKSKE